MGSGGTTADPEKYPPGSWKPDPDLETWLAQALPVEALRQHNIVRMAYEAAGTKHQREPSKEEMYDDGLTFYQQGRITYCLLYTSPSPRDLSTSRMPSSA